MTSYTISKIHAVAPAAKRLTYIPTRLDPRTLLDTLVRLGLTVPTKLAASAALGDLKASGHYFTVQEVDEALSAANVTTSDRIHLKTAMSRNAILRK